MKIAFILLLVLHGLIHLFGFLKAFELAEIQELKLPISKSYGFIWLITSILFIGTAALYFTGSHWYLGFGITAIILSMVLTWQFWEDAKFGSIPNMIIGIVLLFSI